MIDRFEGQYDFLSNFYPSPFKWQDRMYPTVEHFFQAHKAKTKEDFETVMNEPNPGGAKHAGRNIQLREDWEDIKNIIMLTALRLKFNQSQELKERLIATGNKYLVEGNSWHDTYWGVCNGIGKNMLGRLLMLVREEFNEE